MRRIQALFLSIIMLLFLGSCTSNDDGSVEIFGSQYQLKSDEVIDGDLVFFGGTGELEEGSTVEGDLLVAGGKVDVSGTINGDVSVIGGSVSLTDSAEIGGNISSFGGNINRTEGSSINGGIISTNSDLPGMKNDQFNFPVDVFDDMSDQMKIPLRIFMILIWVGFGALMVLIFPKSIENISKVIIDQPIFSIGIGILTIVAGIVAIVTIILLPVICLLSPVFLAIIAFGKIGLGLAIGRKLEPKISSSLSPAILAGIGIFLVEIVSLFLEWIPCVGWMGGLVLSLIGLGAAVVTILGTQPYPRNKKQDNANYTTIIDVQTDQLSDSDEQNRPHDNGTLNE